MLSSWFMSLWFNGTLPAPQPDTSLPRKGKTIAGRAEVFPWGVSWKVVIENFPMLVGI
jgi:hypothetical protein